MDSINTAFRTRTVRLAGGLSGALVGWSVSCAIRHC